MLKKIIVVMLVFGVLFLVGCGSKSINSNQPNGDDDLDKKLAEVNEDSDQKSKEGEDTVTMTSDSNNKEGEDSVNITTDSNNKASDVVGDDKSGNDSISISKEPLVKYDELEYKFFSKKDEYSEDKNTYYYVNNKSKYNVMYVKLKTNYKVTNNVEIFDIMYTVGPNDNSSNQKSLIKNIDLKKVDPLKISYKVFDGSKFFIIKYDYKLKKYEVNSEELTKNYKTDFEVSKEMIPINISFADDPKYPKIIVTYENKSDYTINSLDLQYRNRVTNKQSIISFFDPILPGEKSPNLERNVDSLPKDNKDIDFISVSYEVEKGDKKYWVDYDFKTKLYRVR